MKIAIIGGTFDPIHDGHIAMARYVLKQQYVREVWFMITKDTPLKDRKITAFEDRAYMVEKAIQGYAHMRISRLENERDDRSYTIDTVRLLKQKYPQHDFVWLIGNDQAKQLHEWKDIDELVQLIDFYVFPRIDEVITCTYPHKKMKMPLMDVSSSEIRVGKKRTFVNKHVVAYMNTQGFYVKEFVASKMSERRMLHSERVADVCVELAKVHHVDVTKAYMAGMLHDVCKEWGKPQLHLWMKQFHQERLDEAAPIWHAYVASEYLKHAIGLYDTEILDAIYHHVQGFGTSPLEKILYISDKIEPGRGYDNTLIMDVAKNNLDEGVAYVRQEQIEYLAKERNIHG